MGAIVTNARARRHHERVPAAVTVWLVDLGSGSPIEVRGSLALARDALVFTPKDESLPERRVALREIAQARRLRGSPVLMIVRDVGTEPTRVAFYFVQPPPLEVPDEPTRVAMWGIGRSAKRRVRRQNTSYLGSWNREKKALLVEWERQVRVAVEAARS
jgi:hypothetical protein